MIIVSVHPTVGCGVYPRLEWEGVKPPSEKRKRHNK